MATDLPSLKTDLTRRMDGAMETMRRDFGGLRAGRASPALLEPVKVEAYGSEVPITQVGTIGVPESRMLTVQVWDKYAGRRRRAGDPRFRPRPQPGLRRPGRAGADPAADRRAPDRAVQGRRPVCRGRRASRCAACGGTAWSRSRRAEKKHAIGEDEAKTWSDEVQKLTDSYIKRIDEGLAEKEREIKQV